MHHGTIAFMVHGYQVVTLAFYNTANKESSFFLPRKVGVLKYILSP